MLPLFQLLALLLSAQNQGKITEIILNYHQTALEIYAFLHGSCRKYCIFAQKKEVGLQTITIPTISYECIEYIISCSPLPSRLSPS